MRALAYDRTGNFGEGSFWTGNFGSSTFEINLDGDIIRTHHNAGEVSYGFAIDPLKTVGSTVLWINSAPDSRAIAEYDTSTGTLTGRLMDKGQSGSTAGGLDIVPGTLGRGPSASGNDILHLQQGPLNVPDTFRIRRLHLDQAGQGIPPSPFDRNGSREPDLLVSIDDEIVFERSDRASLNYTIDSFELDLFFDIARNPGDGLGNGGLNGVSAAIFANIGADAAPGLDSLSNTLGIRELVLLDPLLTSPVAMGPLGGKGMVLSNNPISTQPSEWRIPLTPGLPIQAIGDCMRFQGVWVDQSVAGLPFAMTNQVRLCRGPDVPRVSGSFAQALGNNSFNADESAGYFSLTNEETDPEFSIVKATWLINPGDPNNSPATQALFDNLFRWDTDNPNMADLFEGGEGQTFGCTGTYRNGSELSTGLIFAGTPQQNATPCDIDPGVLQGWIGFDAGASSFGAPDGDWLTLEFTFNPDTFMNGEVFEFDADTDGGVGTNGNSMAGVIVTIEFKNGILRSNEMIADLNDQRRGFVQL